MSNLYIEDFVIKNRYSRPAIKRLSTKGIVMHWTATNGATDTNEQAFFDGADGGGGRSASAHFFVDKDSAVLIMPLDEVAYHANEHACRIPALQATADYYKGGGANLTAIGLEMCVEKDGTIHPNTVQRSAQIVAELCKTYKLDPLKDIYRHFDITGKNCPAPWVSNPALFTQFKNTVKGLMGGSAPAKTVAPVTAPTVLRNGNRGGAVQAMQTLLEKAGYDVGAIDGVFGDGTEKAVRAFQSAYKLSVDGICGNQTLAKLKAVVAEKEAKAKAEAEAKAKAQAEAKAKAQASTTSTYKVASGDTLSEIAEKFDTTVANIKSLNGLKSDLIKVGQSLKVPAKKVVAPAKPKGIGTVKVLADKLNVREKADFNSKVVEVVEKGEVFTVIAQKNGLYQLVTPNHFVTSNPEFVKFTKF